MTTIRYYTQDDQVAWDAYVRRHPSSTLYHLSGWKDVIERSYGHSTYYLLACKKLDSHTTPPCRHARPTSDGILHPQIHPVVSEKPLDIVVGILPLVHLKSLLFGNGLISMPYFDSGGILADDLDIERALLDEAIRLGRDLNVRNIELRQAVTIAGLDGKPIGDSTDGQNNSMGNWFLQTRSHKVRMLLELPESSERLLKSFKSKLRSQINRPRKEGFSVRIGGLELLDDFFEVFAINMRDLGSPVHSKSLIRNVMKEFSACSRIFLVHRGTLPIASSLVVGHGDVIGNPWASSLRAYSRMSPNMLLYWAMLEYACEQGFRYFDFGRSSPAEGTYTFKEQWGAKPDPLHWHYIAFDGKSMQDESVSLEKSRFQRAIHCWQRLPVPLTTIIGPLIRKQIGL